MRRALEGARSAVSSFGSAVGSIGSIAGLVGGLGLGAAAVAGFGKSIKEAASIQDLTTNFKVLLGSVQAAKDRMAELVKFAQETHFELGEVASASRALETLTHGALSTGEGLRMVGDVASGTSQPFEEIAMWVGRLYDGLQSGRPVGEAMQRMQELGAVSGEVRTKIERMQQTGQKGAAVWNVMAQALSRFSGLMDEKSRGWNGLISNLSDAVKQAFAAFGAPLLDALSPLLKQAADTMGQLAAGAKDWGSGLATSIGTFQNLIAGGNLGTLSLQAGLAGRGRCPQRLHVGPHRRCYH